MLSRPSTPFLRIRSQGTSHHGSRESCANDQFQGIDELGTELTSDVEVRVWDSTAEERYMVLPERPAGTEKLGEEALAALVTRDAMIGVAKVKMPVVGGRG